MKMVSFCRGWRLFCIIFEVRKRSWVSLGLDFEGLGLKGPPRSAKDTSKPDLGSCLEASEGFLEGVLGALGAILGRFQDAPGPSWGDLEGQEAVFFECFFDDVFLSDF